MKFYNLLLTSQRNKSNQIKSNLFASTKYERKKQMKNQKLTKWEQH